jgi:hypothetical protein
MGLRRERRDEWLELEGVETKMCRSGSPAYWSVSEGVRNARGRWRWWYFGVGIVGFSENVPIRGVEYLFVKVSSLSSEKESLEGVHLV